MRRRTSFVLLSFLAAVSILWPSSVRTQSSADVRRPEHIQGRPVAAGEVLVRLRTSAAAARAQLRLEIDADEDRPIGGGEWRRMHSASRTAQSLLSALSSRGDVLEVEPNYIVTVATVPNDTFFSSLWGLSNTLHPGADIHAVAAWDVTTGSTANVVGVVDTGVDYTHPDLAANMWSAPAAFTVTLAGQTITCPAGSHGFNAILLTCDPADAHGHGTHTAGTIGAVGQNALGVVGVNWATRIMGLRFLDSTGSGTIADAVNAIDFALQAKTAFASSGAANLRVLSNSWGNGGPGSSALEQEIVKAGAADVLFVAAAGNQAVNTDASPFYPAGFPEANIIAVAATDQADGLASFSNYGPTSVDLAAPGDNIVSTMPGNLYGPMSGTSMATPHVAGAAMLILSTCALDTAQVKASILNSVDVLPNLRGIVATNGRLNVATAVNTCTPRQTPPSISLTSPSSGSVYSAPATIQLAASASDSDGIKRVEFYANDQLIGLDSTSPYQATWIAADAGSYKITARAFDTRGGTALSSTALVTVNQPAGRLNVASSANGATVIASSTYSASYAASGAINGDRKGSSWGGGGGWNDGTSNAWPDWLEVDFAGTKTIDEVDVFSLQDNFTAPLEPSRTMAFTQYGLTDFTVQYWTGTQWVAVPGGAVSGNTLVWRQLTFAAVTTPKIRILVSGALASWSRVTEVEAYLSIAATPNVAPTVTLTAPATGTSYTAPALVNFAANAADNDGTVKRVDFLANGTVVGSAATSPYQFTWTTSVPGPYTLTAVATDNLDATTISASASVTVQAVTRTNVASSASGATAIGSSTYSPGYAASGAINGDRKGQPWGNGGGWNDATPNAWPDWLEVDFAGAKTIDEVDVFSVQDNYAAPVEPTATMTFTQYGLTDFTVQYWTGTQWAAVPGGTVSGNTLVWRQLTFGAITTTKIRVFVTGALAVWSRVTEVEAYQSTAAAPNVAPTVTLTAPAAGTSYTAPALVNFAANAADSDGTVKRVDFLANGTVVGSAATSPYQFTWTTSVPGPYTLTAVATDNLDATTISASASVTVQAVTRTNVASSASGATAIGSSTYSPGYAASGAINGDRKGQPWGNGGGWNDATPNAWPDWLEVDFAGAKTIDEVDVFSVQDNYAAPVEPTATMTFTQYGLTDFTVQYWDGAQWLTVPGGIVSGNALIWRQMQFAALTTSKIRVYVTGALNSWSRVAEVEAYEAPAGRTNVALAANGAAAIGSSTYSPGYAAGGAINGDRKGQPWGNGGGWNDATPNAWPDWLEVDFAGAKTIDEVDVFSVQDNYAAPVEPTATMTFTQYGLTDFTVQYWTGTQWAAVPGGTVSGNTLVWRQLTFGAITTTKIRVFVTGALAVWSRITEIEAYSAP